MRIRKSADARLPEGDDGRTIVDMNVEGMPWYTPRQDAFGQGAVGRGDVGQGDVRRGDVGQGVVGRDAVGWGSVEQGVVGRDAVGWGSVEQGAAGRDAFGRHTTGQEIPLTREEARFFTWGALKAALLVTGVMCAGIILFVLFCQFVWFR